MISGSIFRWNSNPSDTWTEPLAHYKDSLSNCGLLTPNGLGQHVLNLALEDGSIRVPGKYVVVLDNGDWLPTVRCYTVVMTEPQLAIKSERSFAPAEGRVIGG